ncbi:MULTISPECIES: DUF58 domain-containing protein [Eubacteriales]|uniref:DUF58 domain-containing protein n=1 Tax=Bittarella massiliensis (ex Durand et al. 2017) TaxID=1720313 RepID=A0AAQ1MBY3_9FIRM|nr:MULTISPECIES: DUF58 domain-containing protein [Eubacteriales]ERI97690.1 hypothetical protein HMPREF0262_03187 [Clostridium sp. ATCC 29733]MZL69626.1 DUF58 domain-containing protein [Bittarella massiliensis (ex Durand et al. 2017)]MZL80543.1 DUF58 domain-containing protein [Bittarella massiliensis (ex Durand et al. 2017)]SHF80341.1 Uncharacterized conserved protein, DUF58 family, contains vWF domain [Bittarella massiliensis (ex Durand et al. 2017)]
MWFRKCVYGLLVVGMALFSVFYKDYLSYLTFAITLLLPLLLYILLQVAVRYTKISLACEHYSVVAGDLQTLHIKARVRSFLPVSECRVTLVCRHQYYGGEDVQTVVFPLFPLNRQDFTFPIRALYDGNAVIEVRSIVYFDAFKLWKRRAKELPDPVPFTVMPVIYEIESNMAQRHALGESDTFDQNRFGDDYSETFGIRDYQPGDKLQRIHWKLTASQGRFMVRQGSYPLQNAPLLLLELWADPSRPRYKKELSAALDACASLSFYLLDQVGEHQLCWCDESGLHRYPVRAEEEVLDALQQVFGAKPYADRPHMLQDYYLDQLAGTEPYAFYVTPNLTEEVAKDDRLRSFGDSFTIFYTNPDGGEQAQGPGLVPIDPDQVGASLQNLML